MYAIRVVGEAERNSQTAAQRDRHLNADAYGAVRGIHRFREELDVVVACAGNGVDVSSVTFIICAWRDAGRIKEIAVTTAHTAKIVIEGDMRSLDDMMTSVATMAGWRPTGRLPFTSR